MNGLAAARAATERNPTKEQIEAGNYRHGKVQVHGLAVSLENPKGSVRRGIGRNGMMWETKMTADYGRILGTKGADDEHLDVFIGPDSDSELVYVIDQVYPDSGRFDEHKVMLGTDSEAEARALYLSNYTPGWKGLGEITALTLDEFKAWLEHHDTSKPIASKKVAPREVFKSIWNTIVKATQFGLFVPAQEVQEPGKRGGRYYRTKTGKVRYGEKPMPVQESAARALERIKAEIAERGVYIDEEGRAQPGTKPEALRESIEATFKPKPGEAVDPLGMVRLKPVEQFVVSPTGIVASLNEAAHEEQIATERAEQPDPKTAEKLRGLADSMASQVDQYQNPAVSHQNATARRANIAANMAQHGDWLADVQAILYGLADLHENGKVPAVLQAVKSRALVEDLLNSPPDVGHPQHGERMNRKSRFPYARVDRHYIGEVKQRSKGVRMPPEVRRVFDRVALREVNQYDNVRLHSLEEIEAVEFVAKKLVGTKDQYGHADDYYARQVLGDFGRPKRALKAGLDTEEKWDAAAIAIRDFRKVTDRSGTRKIQEMERALIGRKIPGYFPTPTVTVEHLLDLADIQPGQVILEPSAGKGNIADVIHARHPDNVLFVNEYNDDLSAILDQKGYKDEHYLNEFRPGAAVVAAVAGARFHADFLSLFPSGMPHRRIDRIVMNPPFENGQDVQHVMHAYDVVAPGGRVVSIMGEHVFFANDKRSQEFRSWLATHGREEKLPAGSFLSSERSTGVAARVVVIDKPADVQKAKAPPAQGALFGPRAEVQRPGIRGGRFYITEGGHVRYGEKPSGASEWAGAARVQQEPVMLPHSGFLSQEYVETPADAARIFRTLADLDRERFYALHLGADHRAIAIECISQGTLNMAPVLAREALKNAIRLGTKRMVFFHNHPSGQSYPSPEDLATTGALSMVAREVGIMVDGGMIVTRDKYVVMHPSGTDFEPVEWDNEPTASWAYLGGVLTPKQLRPPAERELPAVEGRLRVLPVVDRLTDIIGGGPINTPLAAAELARAILAPETKQVALMLSMDNGRQVQGVFPIAHGAMTVESLRRAMRLAFGSGAASVVVVASDDGVEWQADVETAAVALKEMMAKTGVQLSDVVKLQGQYGYWSWHDAGGDVKNVAPVNAVRGHTLAANAQDNAVAA